MSFQYIPSPMRIPNVPNFSPPEGVWRGRGADSGYFVLKGVSSTWGTNVMSKQLIFSLQVDGSELRPAYSSVNGYMHWSGSGYFYYSRSWGWIYIRRGFPGYEPIETFNSETRRYEGDEFYAGSFPYGTSEVTLTGRGTARNDSAQKSVSAKWPRWVPGGYSEFGVYTGVDGAGGERHLGVPRFRGNNEHFVRSVAKTNGHYTYGGIRYEGGKWVYGEVGAAAGWHEGSEPSVGGSVTFQFARNEGSEAQGSSFSVSLYDWVRGDETEAAYLGEVAMWR